MYSIIIKNVTERAIAVAAVATLALGIGFSFPAATFAVTYSDATCCGYDSTYTPSYDSTYSPSYDSSYSPSYDSSYYPSYDSTYSPSYDSSYYPSYDSSYYPSYDSSYYPSYDSTYSPSYDSSYWPSYDTSYYPSYDSTYTPSYDSTYSPSYDSSYTPSYDSTYTPVYQNGVRYSYSPSSYSSYSPTTYNQGDSSAFGLGLSFNFGSGQTTGCGSSCGGGCGGTCGHPTYPTTPCCQSTYTPSQPINIINNNNNTNTNTNVNTNTAPVVPVIQAPITYPVQYVYPTTYQSYPIYTPTYTYPTYQPQPYCTITISGNAYGNYGTYNNQLATLTWSSSNATSAYISPSVGSVSTYGSRTVYPTGNSIYTMTVSGSGGSATCQTSAYYMPSAPYVALTQIPYTGFDFGPVGNALYWLSLLSFAAAGAYLLVYYRGGAMVLASQMIGRASTKVEAAVTKTAQKIETVIEPVLASLQNLPVKEEYSGISDSMTLVHSKDGEAPRIVITRN